jgi:hypothetical protein
VSAEWTFMVYMAGYNNLSAAAGTDLEEMRQVGSSDKVKLLAFVKQLDQRSAYHILVGKNGKGEKKESLGNKDSGHPQTVLDFIRWGVKTAPAERYALVFWNHGSGWEPQDFEEIYSQVRGDVTEGETREFSFRANQPIARSVFTTTLRHFLELDREDRAICSDDGSGHSLDTIELGRVLKAGVKEIGQKFDLVGMDACLMSNLEVAYQIRAEADALVGSEELEPNAGWPYHRILADLAAKPTMDGPALAKTVVERYVASYKNSDREWPVTQCAVATEEVKEFSEAVDAVSKALRDQIKSDWKPVLQSHLRSVPFEMKLIDLKTFCEGVRASSAKSSLKQAAGKLLEAMKPNGYVLAEGHLGGKVQGCGGISVYFPAASDPVSRFYRDLRFSKSHDWDDFLRSYSRAVREG